MESRLVIRNDAFKTPCGLSLFRKGSLRAGAKPRITDSVSVRSCVRVCLDRNRTLNFLL